MNFLTPNYCVCVPPKVGTCSLARAIIKTYYPKIMLDDNEVHCEQECPQTYTPDRPTIGLVREPIERFRSAMAEDGLQDTDAVLDSLERNDGAAFSSRHFALQADFIVADAVLYRFPEQLNAVAAILGLPLPLPWQNKARNEKPMLTSEQTRRIAAYYTRDCELYQRAGA